MSLHGYTVDADGNSDILTARPMLKKCPHVQLPDSYADGVIQQSVSNNDAEAPKTDNTVTEELAMYQDGNDRANARTSALRCEDEGVSVTMTSIAPVVASTLPTKTHVETRVNVPMVELAEEQRDVHDVTPKLVDDTDRNPRAAVEVDIKSEKTWELIEKYDDLRNIHWRHRNISGEVRSDSVCSRNAA